ncbi:ATP-binding protein [Spirillospora sp. NPDC052242]
MGARAQARLNQTQPRREPTARLGARTPVLCYARYTPGGSMACEMEREQKGSSMTLTTPAPEVPTLVLQADERAASVARRFVAEQFREWGVRDDYTGRLVVCELVTNGYRHGEGPIVVRVFRDERDGLVVIEVWDAGAGRPVVRPPDHGGTSGRGLLLVSGLVHSWGVRELNEGGKVAWAKLHVE